MPRQGLNRRKVLEAALRVIDDEGLDALTMRRLAQVLGVEAPSLYKHIRAKTDILNGVAELIYEEIDFGDPEGCFRERIQQYAASCREALLRHPNVVPVLATRPATGQATVALAETAMAQLESFGFDAEEGRRFLNVAFSFIVGHTLAEVGIERPSFTELRAGRRRGSDANAAGRAVGFRSPDRAEFELGVDLLVAGLQDKAAGIHTDLHLAGEAAELPHPAATPVNRLP